MITIRAKSTLVIVRTKTLQAAQVTKHAEVGTRPVRLGGPGRVVAAAEVGLGDAHVAGVLGEGHAEVVAAGVPGAVHAEVHVGGTGRLAVAVGREGGVVAHVVGRQAALGAAAGGGVDEAGAALGGKIHEETAVLAHQALVCRVPAPHAVCVAQQAHSATHSRREGGGRLVDVLAHPVAGDGRVDAAGAALGAVVRLLVPAVVEALAGGARILILISTCFTVRIAEVTYSPLVQKSVLYSSVVFIIRMRSRSGPRRIRRSAVGCGLVYREVELCRAGSHALVRVAGVLGRVAHRREAARAGGRVVDQLVAAAAGPAVSGERALAEVALGIAVGAGGVGDSPLSENGVVEAVGVAGLRDGHGRAVRVAVGVREPFVIPVCAQAALVIMRSSTF